MPVSTYPTLSNALPSSPYILSIHPSSSSPHLILRHPTPNLTLADNQTLQAVDELTGGHDGNIMAISSGSSSSLSGNTSAPEGLWSGGRDAAVVRWDERSRRPATKIKAFVRKPLPVLALTASERDNLVIAGTEVASSESHIIFWDTRSPSKPLHIHSSTHSDDITHLSLLPSTSNFLSSTITSTGETIPDRILLSSSTDGLIALTNIQESDEDEAVLCAENFGESLADAGWYVDEKSRKGKGNILKAWGRSDMDAVGVWDIEQGEGDDAGPLQLSNLQSFPTDTFKFRSFPHPNHAQGPSIPRTAEEERAEKNSSEIRSDYLIGVTPTLGISSAGLPMTAVGTNEGDIVLLHHSDSSEKSPYNPSGFFLTPPTPSRGHKDVIRGIYHDISNEAVYTGSEDGVLSGWSLSGLPSRPKIGDKDIDDFDENDEDDEDDDEQSEESEIETEDSDDESDGMDLDVDEYEKGPRNGPTLGLAARRERKKERSRPY